MEIACTKCFTFAIQLMNVPLFRACAEADRLCSFQDFQWPPGLCNYCTITHLDQ